MAKITTIEELRKRKLELKAEVEQLEGLLTFESPKESLSVLSGGLSDQFLTEKVAKDGETKLAIKTAPIIKGLGNSLLGKKSSRSLLAFDHTNAQSNLLETSLKLGTAALVGNLAKKSIRSKSWRNRILGLVLIYVAPMALRFLRSKLEIYEKNKSVSSLEKLI